MKNNQIKIKVKAFGINRLDLEMIKHNKNIGIEVSGIITELGSSSTRFKIGDKVCSLLREGGYQEEVIASEETTFPLPDHLNFNEGAALPESLFTLTLNLFEFAKVSPGERLLIHSATGGIGNLALEISRAMNLQVDATTSRPEHKSTLKSWGAQTVYGPTDSWDNVETYDIILDNSGAKSFTRNISSLKKGGRLAMIDAFTGEKSEIDLGLLLDNSLQIYGSLLRPRTIEQKLETKKIIEEKILPLLSSAKIKPHVMKTFNKVEEAHDLLKNCQHLGKLIGVRELSNYKSTF